MDDDYAEVQQLPAWSTGDGVGWQPNTVSGVACQFSATANAVVVHGGVAPGLGRSADLSLGHVEKSESTALPSLRWKKLTPSLKIPRRCWHGTAVLSGADGGDRLLIFGGEGEPMRSSSSKEETATRPAIMNDCFSVELATGRATNLIATDGTPPTPRSHHTLSALRDPRPPAPMLAAGRIKSKGMALLMANRASFGSAFGSADGGSGKDASKAKPAGSADGSSAKSPSTAQPADEVPRPSMEDLGKPEPGGAKSWTVLALGGRTGGVDGGITPEDMVHVLKLSESGMVKWVPTMEYLSEAIRKRQQEARVKAESDRMIEQGSKEARSPSPSPGAGPSASETKMGRRATAAFAAAAAEKDFKASMAASLTSFEMLQRSRHTTVVAGSVALVFGGVHKGRATADLICVRFRDIAVTQLPTYGTPPAARHSHAAALGGGGMILCGGFDTHRIHDDVHLLTIPSLTWSTPRISTPSAPLARHGHGVASVSLGELIVYGGYAAVTTKLDRTAPGGFAPSVAYVVRHSHELAALDKPAGQQELAPSHSASSLTSTSASESAASEPAITPRPVAADVPAMAGQPAADGSARSVAADQKEARHDDSPVPVRGNDVRSIINNITAVSSWLPPVETGAEEPQAAGEEMEIDIETASESVEHLERWISETSTSLAWLSEEEARLREELAKVEAQADSEDKERERLEVEMDDAVIHLKHLHAHVEAQTRVCGAARNTLESSHVTNSQQIHQLLETVERILAADRDLLKNGEIERIMTKVRMATDDWLREAADLGSQLHLQPRVEQREKDKDSDAAISRAMHAAARSRGALVDRAHASHLELSSIRVKLAFNHAANEKEAIQAEASHEKQLKQLSDVQASEAQSVIARDMALAEISELVSCARSAEAALVALQQHEDRLSNAHTDVADGEGSRASGEPSPSLATRAGANSRAQQLTSVAGLLNDVASSGSEQIIGRWEQLVSSAMQEPERAAGSGVGKRGGGGAGRDGATSSATAAPKATGSLGMNTALRLAARRVCKKREQSSGRWAQLISSANAMQAQERAARSSSEATALKQVERKLHRLSMELKTCERAIEHSDSAKQRVEARLAKELYFQQLFRQGIEDHRKVAEPKGWAAKGPNEREQVIVKMNTLRKRAEGEAQRLSKQLQIALKTREEEHSARVRGQMQGTVRRMLQAALGDDEVAAMTTKSSSANASRVSSRDRSRRSSSTELEQPGLDGSAEEEEEDADRHADAPMLLDIAESLSSKSQLPGQGDRLAARASNCAEVLRTLAGELDGSSVVDTTDTDGLEQ